MRARHRHFKPKAAGASIALDTRYIHQTSDNTTVETWTDRSGNDRNATQSDGARRATYRTQIQGGNGILRFDGGDRYNASFVTGNQYSLYCVYKRTSSNTNAFSNATVVVAAGIANNTASTARRYQLTYNDDSGGLFSASSNVSAAANIARDNNFNVHSITALIGSGTKRYLLNGGSEVTADASLLAGVSSGTVRISIGANSWDNTLFFNGDMGMLTTYESAHSASLRRRLEHAAAFSFKIACN